MSLSMGTFTIDIYAVRELVLNSKTSNQTTLSLKLPLMQLRLASRLPKPTQKANAVSTNLAFLRALLQDVRNPSKLLMITLMSSLRDLTTSMA